MIGMWISKVDSYFEIVNLKKVLLIAFKTAKQFEARARFYRDQLATNEEVNIDTGRMCRITTKYDWAEKPFTETVKLTLSVSKKFTKTKHVVIGHYDENGGFDEIAEVHFT
jgi:hypothetical protein